MAHVPIALREAVWVGDFMYLPTREGFLYLAIVLDLGARRCVDSAMRDMMEVELVTNALRMALYARQPAPGLIFRKSAEQPGVATTD